MKGKFFQAILSVIVLIPLLLMAGFIAANDKESKKTVCANPHPEQLCSAANTCGANGTPCILKVKRSGGGTEASVKPNLPNFPKDAVICINKGTSVTWEGDGKNTGLMVDFGDSSPFDQPGTLRGGSDHPVTVVAKTAGCFKYALSACNAGAIQGMCGNSNYELIVTGGAN